MTTTTDAACIPYVNAGLDLWFEPSDRTKGRGETRREQAQRIREARAICRDCPALNACHEYALTHDEAGIYAGMTERERARMKRPPVKRAQPTAPCGTLSAYQRHLRHRETPCRACRDAHNELQRERRRRKAGAA